VIFISSFDDEIFFPTLMVVLEDYSSLGMGLQILLRSINFRSFLKVAARKIILAIFVPAVMSSTLMIRILSSPTMSIKMFGYFSLAY
jgi:hypothetical protein